MLKNLLDKGSRNRVKLRELIAVAFASLRAILSWSSLGRLYVPTAHYEGTGPAITKGARYPASICPDAGLFLVLIAVGAISHVLKRPTFHEGPLLQKSGLRIFQKIGATKVVNDGQGRPDKRISVAKITGCAGARAGSGVLRAVR